MTKTETKRLSRAPALSQRERERETETERETERDRQTDRQTDRKREREFQRCFVPRVDGFSYSRFLAFRS